MYLYIRITKLCCATQCNLLNAHAPLELFPKASVSLDDSFATETEPDLDTMSWKTTQQSKQEHTYKVTKNSHYIC